MNPNLSRIQICHDEFCCARNAKAAFQRSSSLRLRGEKMVQRSPLSSRRIYPVITENPRQKYNDGARSIQNNDRPRSHSLSLNAQNKPIIKHCMKSQRHSMERNVSITDSAHTPPGSPEDLLDDDSMKSYDSVATATSMDVGYAPFNGTTFSGRSMRYVLHCSSHAGLSGDEYLTPTQRAQRQIKILKNLLNEAKKDLENKDSEIFQLTREVVELRLYKASVSAQEDKSNSSETVTVREAEELTGVVSPVQDIRRATYDVTDGGPYKPETPTRCRNNELHGSFTDSGHFDDLTNLSLHSKETVITHDIGCMTEAWDYDTEKSKLISFYEKKIEDLVRSHIGETQELKNAHNDKVESLLQKLANVNTSYSEILPQYEEAKERVHSLQKKLEEVSEKLQNEEQNQSAVYKDMYNKGMEAAKLENDNKEYTITDDLGTSKRVCVEDLLQQLQITQTELENVRDTAFMERTSNSQVLLSAKEAVSLWVLGARKAMYRRIVESQKGKGSVDPEATLQFLKSAIYYFLTDPEHHQGHLNAIENILGFTEAEKLKIRNARSS